MSSGTATGIAPPPRAAREAAERPPTARQIYALAAALCERQDEAFPETRAEASELIERLRVELGHPAPRLEDCVRVPRPRAARGRRRGRGGGTDKLASAIAAALVREMR